MEAIDDLWFFGNLFNISIKHPLPFMSRCFSDPCPSSSSTTNDDNNNNNDDIVIKAELLENKKKKKDDNIIIINTESPRRSGLVRAPSLPIMVGEEIEEEELKIREEDTDKVRICDDESERNNKVLSRTQTLPTSMRNVEIISDHNNLHVLPKRHHNKGNSRYRPPRNANPKGIIGTNTNSDGSKEMRRRYLLNRKTMRRSASELEIEEVQGFKDLGFTFDKKDLLSPKVFNILPGLQQKPKEETDLEIRRPYLSEAWTIQSCVAPAPNWALSKSSEDMKAQIKYWARSVASNVRMEC